MTINSRTKIYWARTGPPAIFGKNWPERKELSDEEAEELFDHAWHSKIEPAIRSSRPVSPTKALKMIPDDGRRDFFDPGQEHREVSLGGIRLLAQLDPFNDELNQMWHLKAADKWKSKKPSLSSRSIPLSVSSRQDRQEVPSIRELENLDKASLAELISRSVAAMLLKM